MTIVNRAVSVDGNKHTSYEDNGILGLFGIAQFLNKEFPTGMTAVVNDPATGKNANWRREPGIGWWLA